MLQGIGLNMFKEVEIQRLHLPHPSLLWSAIAEWRDMPQHVERKWSFRYFMCPTLAYCGRPSPTEAICLNMFIAMKLLRIHLLHPR